MTNETERMREAYATLHAPDQAKAAALARIEALRQKQETSLEQLSDAEVFAPLYDESTCSEQVSSMSDVVAPASDCAVDARGAAEAVWRGPSPRGKTRRAARPRFVRRAVLAAAACLAVAAIGVGGYAYAMTPVAVVGIEVNPSFELSINRLDRVVEARAVNDDAAAVLQQVDVCGMGYEEAIEALADACAALIGPDATVEVAVACDDAATCEAIERCAASCFSASGSQVHCGRATDEEVQAAEDAGMSLGRYRVYQALVEQSVDISQDEAASMTMRELRALAAEEGVDTADTVCEGCEAGHAGQGSGNGSGNGNGSGQGSGNGNGSGNGSGAGHGHGHGDGSGNGHGRASGASAHE